jgi:hypothetical protein
MERKDRNAEGKNICMPNNKLYFGYALHNFHQKSIHIKCYYFQKRKVFSKMIFLMQVKKYS